MAGTKLGANDNGVHFSFVQDISENHFRFSIFDAVYFGFEDLELWNWELSQADKTKMELRAENWY